MIDPLQKVFFAGMRMFGEDRHGVLGHIGLACLARPAPHIAISQQGESSQLIATPSVLQVGQKIVKAQLEA
jgi:hypothetical protein